MVAPSFLALTSTPSIAPSSLEVTIPPSAVCADAPPGASAAAISTAPSHECLSCMGNLPIESVRGGNITRFGRAGKRAAGSCVPDAVQHFVLHCARDTQIEAAANAK